MAILQKMHKRGKRFSIQLCHHVIFGCLLALLLLSYPCKGTVVFIDMHTFKIFTGDFNNDCTNSGQIGSVMVGGSCFVFMNGAQTQQAVSFVCVRCVSCVMVGSPVGL
jgi:hypothetical protein